MDGSHRLWNQREFVVTRSRDEKTKRITLGVRNVTVNCVSDADLILNVYHVK